MPIADTGANTGTSAVRPRTFSFSLISSAQAAEIEPREPPPEPPLESVYPVEALLGGAVARAAARAAAQQVTNALRALRLAIQTERVRRLEQEVQEIEATVRRESQNERGESTRPGPDPKKTEAAFKRQLEEKGLTSLRKSRRSIETQLRIHEEKLRRDSMNGGKTSSIEREIRSFKMQLEVLNRLIQK